jgi:hypothetical protein
MPELQERYSRLLLLHAKWGNSLGHSKWYQRELIHIATSTMQSYCTGDQSSIVAESEEDDISDEDDVGGSYPDDTDSDYESSEDDAGDIYVAPSKSPIEIDGSFNYRSLISDESDLSALHEFIDTLTKYSAIPKDCPLTSRQILQLRGSRMLDADCLYYGSLGLQRVLADTPASANVAVFNTYHMSWFTGKSYVISKFYRNVQKTEYWTKSVWVIPIFIPERLHFVVASIFVDTGMIYFSDSYGEKLGKYEDQLLDFLDTLIRESKSNGNFIKAPKSGWKWVSTVVSESYVCHKISI